MADEGDILLGCGDDVDDREVFFFGDDTRAREDGEGVVVGVWCMSRGRALGTCFSPT